AFPDVFFLMATPWGAGCCLLGAVRIGGAGNDTGSPLAVGFGGGGSIPFGGVSIGVLPVRNCVVGDQHGQGCLFLDGSVVAWGTAFGGADVISDPVFSYRCALAGEDCAAIATEPHD